ncbi:hypothetical protein ACFPCV_29110 [Actinophytocola glycyrrhizae]|uniref:Uncharacterized protein n=1 Tax=Actinophytocola glycyrrhizae TaxID=2044873 RepID=A0ABV9S8P3_9PSEU
MTSADPVPHPSRARLRRWPRAVSRPGSAVLATADAAAGTPGGRHLRA